MPHKSTALGCIASGEEVRAAETVSSRSDSSTGACQGAALLLQPRSCLASSTLLLVGFIDLVLLGFVDLVLVVLGFFQELLLPAPTDARGGPPPNSSRSCCCQPQLTQVQDLHQIRMLPATSHKAEYKKKRKLGQESRLKSDDIAQNKGGSRPYGQTKQYLRKKYGPEAATDVNTYLSMKSGVKNCDSNGRSGPINNSKSQKRVSDYFESLQAEHPEDSEECRRDENLDVNIVYKAGHGMPHGRVLIANGAVRKSDIIATARGNTTRQTNSTSYQELVRRNALLEQGAHIGLILTKHMQALYAKLDMEVPAEITAIQALHENICRQPSHQVTESSHAENEASVSHDDEDGNANLE